MLDITISDDVQINNKQKCNITVRNGKLLVNFHFLYKDDTVTLDLRSILGDTIDDTAEDKWVKYPAMPSVDLIIINLRMCRFLEGTQAYQKVNSILHCIISSCPNIKNIFIKRRGCILTRFLVYSFGLVSSSSINDASHVAVTSKEFEKFMDNSSNAVIHLMRSTEKHTFSLTTFTRALYNNAKYWNFNRIEYLPSDHHQMHPASLQLNFSGLYRLYQFDFDVSRIDLERYQGIFFKIMFININNNKEKETLYYKCEARRELGIFSLAPTTLEYMNENNKLDSAHTLIITFNFSTIDVFSIYHTYPSSGGGSNKQEVTLRASVSILDNLNSEVNEEMKIMDEFPSTMIPIDS